MATYFPDDFKETLRDQVSIVDVIQRLGGNIIQSGSSYTMSCPFHDDEKPSMVIHPGKNYFQCFGCGAGTRFHDTVRTSDIFGYVMGSLNLSFYEAVQWISNEFRIYPPEEQLSPEEQLKVQQKAWWKEVVSASNERFKKNLASQEEAYYYLRARGINDLDIDQWEIGFGDSEQVEFKHSDGKLTFPIRDEHGRIVSFIARVPLNEEDLFELNEEEKSSNKRVTPKYEHRWKLKPNDVNQQYYDNHPYKSFEKSKHLYGYYEAKSVIRRYGSAIVVEGFTDIISLHKHHLNHAVSTMGLRLTEEQVLLLKKAGAKEVILMMDGDESGVRAMEENEKILKQHGIRVAVCPMPFGKDPDTLSKEFNISTDDYARFVRNNLRTVAQWKIERVYKGSMEDILLYNNKIHEIRTHQIEEVAKALSEEQDVIEKDLLIHQYSGLFNISPESMREYIYN